MATEAIFASSIATPTRGTTTLTSSILGRLGWNRTLFAAILLFGLLAMTARPATDPDLWWHLRTGQWIVETGHIPHADPFSFTREGSPWISHEWLSEVIFYELWRLAGPPALIIFSAIVTSLGFLLLYWRCPGEPYIAAAAVALGAWASAPCWGTRPQMFTFLLASLFLWLLARAENPGRQTAWFSQAGVKNRPLLLLWIPPLFLLWLNLHAGFALGPALVFLYGAGVACEAIGGTTPWSEARLTILRLAAIIFFCLILVPLNPSGTALYRYPLDTLRSPGMRTFIVEWFSPDFHQLLYTPLLLVVLSLLIALAWSRSSLRARVLLPLVAMCLAALDAVRHIPIFILLAIPVIAAAAPYPLRISPSLPLRPPNRRIRQSFHVAAVALLALFTLVRWTTLSLNENARVQSQFPQQAVLFLRDTGQPPRLFAYYDWGGYAIWTLYPHYRVFIDGRSDLYGDKFLEQSIQTATHLEQGWCAILDEANVDTVLMPSTAPLTQGLARDPHWITVYRDSKAVIFVRRPRSLTSVPSSSTAPSNRPGY